MASFYLDLFSNVAYEGNTIAEFTTTLAKPLLLATDYEVALKEISFPNTWFNLPQDGLVTLICHERAIVEGSLYAFSTTIPAGRYDDREKLIEICNNAAVALHNAASFDVLVEPSMLFLNEEGLVKQRNPKFYNQLYFSESLRGLLGAGISQPLESVANILQAQNSQHRHVESNISCYELGERRVCVGNIKDGVERALLFVPELGDLNAGLHSLLVYTDIVRHSHVGDRLVPLLKVVHVGSDTRYREQVFREYAAPEFKPLVQREVYQIQISLHRSTGELVNFKTGEVRLTLHFKPIGYGF